MKKRLLVAVVFALVLVMSLAGIAPASATTTAGYSALFAGTSDPAKVYMYTGSGTAWEDISGTSLSAEFAVLDLIQYQGQLYAGTMDYANGGRVWRYEGGTTWTLVFDAEWPEYQVASLAVYNDTLYAGTAWDGGNLYCYNTDTETFDYVDTMGDTDSDGNVHAWAGIRCMYPWSVTGDLHLGDIGYDCLGRYNGTSMLYDAFMSGSCIYDFAEYDSEIYAAAWSSRLLWSATGTGYPWSYEEPIPGIYHIWELEVYDGDLYMAYDDGTLATYNGHTLGATTVLTADDSIISMTTDGTLLYYGLGDEAGYGGYGEGPGLVYSYNGSTATLISGEMGDGVQVLYIGNPGLICDKVLWDYSDEGDGDGIIEVGEEWWFSVMITVQNVSPGDVTEFVIKDNIAGDLLINAYWMEGDLDWTYLPPPGESKKKKVDGYTDGIITIEWTGKTKKAHVYFNDLGTLEPGESITLWLWLITDINPGNHQEYTSEGPTDLNSGATAKGMLYGYEAEAVSASIEVDVQPYVFTPSL